MPKKSWIGPLVRFAMTRSTYSVWIHLSNQDRVVSNVQVARRASGGAFLRKRSQNHCLKVFMMMTVTSVEMVVIWCVVISVRRLVISTHFIVFFFRPDFNALNLLLCVFLVSFPTGVPLRMPYTTITRHSHYRYLEVLRMRCLRIQTKIQMRRVQCLQGEGRLWEVSLLQ